MKDYVLDLPASIDPVLRERVMEAARKADAFESRPVSFSPALEVKAPSPHPATAPSFEVGDSGVGELSPELAEKYAELARLRAADDELNFCADLYAAEEDDRQAEKARLDAEMADLITRRESAYIRLVKNRAGEIVPAESYNESAAAREKLIEDTALVAMKLEAAARPALGTGPQAWITCPVTGQSKPQLNVKNRMILPSAAAAKRAPMIAALEMLLRRKEHRFDRFCTFTHGPRIPLRVETDGKEVRDGLRALHRKLSKLNAEPFMKKAGAEILFRSSELGGFHDEHGKPNKDEAGNWTVHLHIHAIIHFRRYLAKKDFSQWRRDVWDFWAAHWSDDGALENVREACKYVTKPGDLLALSPAELAALDLALLRLHRVQPLAQLREQVRARRESCLRPARVRRGDRLEFAVVPDWNARKRDRKRAVKTANKAEKKKGYTLTPPQPPLSAPTAPLTAQQGDLFRPFPPIEPPQTAPQGGLTASQPPPVKRPPCFKNRVVARLAPATYFGRVTAPALLVWSDRKPDLKTLLEQPIVREVAAAARPLVLAALERARVEDAAKVNVHTNPVTVRPQNIGPDPSDPFLSALLRPQTWQTALQPATA